MSDIIVSTTVEPPQAGKDLKIVITDGLGIHVSLSMAALVAETFCQQLWNALGHGKLEAHPVVDEKGNKIG